MPAQQIATVGQAPSELLDDPPIDVANQRFAARALKLLQAQARTVACARAQQNLEARIGRRRT